MNVLPDAEVQSLQNRALNLLDKLKRTSQVTLDQGLNVTLFEFPDGPNNFKSTRGWAFPVPEWFKNRLGIRKKEERLNRYGGLEEFQTSSFCFKKGDVIWDSMAAYNLVDSHGNKSPIRIEGQPYTNSSYIQVIRSRPAVSTRINFPRDPGYVEFKYNQYGQESIHSMTQDEFVEFLIIGEKKGSKMTKRIFISHASKDINILKRLEVLLCTALKVNDDNIFCTSLYGTGIKPGEDFLSRIKEEIQSPDLAIILITPNFLRSQFCLCEWGAIWAKSTEKIALITPDVSFKDLESIISSSQIIDITDQNRMGDAADKISATLGTRHSSSRWTAMSEEFVADVTKILEQNEVTEVVSEEKYMKLKFDYEDSKTELKAAFKEIKSKDNLIEKLMNAKDATEANEIRFNLLSDKDKFEALCSDVTESMSDFPRLVDDVLFYETKGEELLPNSHDYTQRDYTESEDLGFITEGAHGVVLDKENPQIAEALQKILILNNFMGSCSEEFIENYVAKYKHQFSIYIKPFWDEHIY